MGCRPQAHDVRRMSDRPVIGILSLMVKSDVDRHFGIWDLRFTVYDLLLLFLLLDEMLFIDGGEREAKVGAK